MSSKATRTPRLPGRLATKMPVGVRLFGLFATTALIAAAPQAQAQTITYTYNALGRLVAVADSTGPTVDYTYDDAGNRTQTDTTVPPSPRDARSRTPFASQSQGRPPAAATAKTSPARASTPTKR